MRGSKVQHLPQNYFSSYIPLHIHTHLPTGSEFNADLVTPFNWEGGEIFKFVRGSKREVWACKFWLSEGFTINVKGQKIRGNPGNWLIVDGTEHYILTETMFRKKFWNDNE